MTVPIGNIKFSQVQSEMESNGESNVDTQEIAFALSINGTFNATYNKSPGNWLSEFQDYEHTSGGEGIPSGTFVCAVAWDENIYISADYGATWTRQSFISREFYDCWVSTSGQYMIAVDNDGYIYYNDTYGLSTSWSPAIAAGQKAWRKLAGNEIAQYVTEDDGAGDDGYIYTSVNYGVSWSSIGTGGKNWRGVAVSSDNNYLTGVVNSSYIYTWSGSAWSQRGTSQSWTDIAMSSNGQYQTAVTNDGKIHISINYGVTWNEIVDKTTTLVSVDMTSNGQYQQVVGNDYIYYSTDYGATWNDGDDGQNRVAVIVSSLFSGTVSIYANGDTNLSKSTNFGITVNAITVSPIGDMSRDWKAVSCNKGDNSTPVIGTASVGTILAESIQINWTAATSINGIAKYKFYWKISGGSYAEIDVGTALTYTKTGLDIGTTYLFYVTAEDGFGNVSADSNIITQATSSTHLSVDPLTWNFASTSAPAKTFTVTANAGNSWTVSGEPLWASIVPSGGTGNGSFDVTVDDNTGGARSDTFQVTSDAPTVDIDIDQDAV